MGNPGRSVSQRWEGPDGPLGEYIRKETHNTLEAYRNQPNYVDRDGKAEESKAKGGYAGRQLLELVQNSADALEGTKGGRIEVHLDQNYLYCADNGNPIGKDGITALMFSYLSTKQGVNQIGRFGLGFRSVLEITDSPEFFCRAGSFGFSRSRAKEKIEDFYPDAQYYPVLNLPFPLAPEPEFESDPILKGLSTWAMNIVRLPLKPGAGDGLIKQIRSFPSELLLFVEHVKEMKLSMKEYCSKVTLERVDDLYLLHKDDDHSLWKLFECIYELSDEALEDAKPVYEEDSVLITWAVPIDRMNAPSYKNFWIFFPTKTASLVAGILNARWKPHEDRHNLLSGAYNKELIDDTADLIIDYLDQLSTDDDPAQHLDALPRRLESGDSALTNQLRDKLYSGLVEHEVVPDQDGQLQKIRDISYPPINLPVEALNMWSDCKVRPSEWLHHTARTRTRFSVIERIFEFAKNGRSSLLYSYLQIGSSRHVPVSSLSEWLEALVNTASSEEDSVHASIVAVQIAAILIDDDKWQDTEFGNILLSASNNWCLLDADSLFLGGEEEHTDMSKASLVHPQLESDPETLRILQEYFRFDSMSSELAFRRKVEDLYQRGEWEKLWTISRDANALWLQIIQDQPCWYNVLRLRSVSGEWYRFSELLLPGYIVPSDGSRDAINAIDIEYHHQDLDLVQKLGMPDRPIENYDYKEIESREYNRYKYICYRQYLDEEFLYSHPRRNLMEFDDHMAIGPLKLFEYLSEEGNALYTEAILEYDSIFEPWILRYKGKSTEYPSKEFDSPAIKALLEDGHIRVGNYGISKLSDGLGIKPKSEHVRRWLLEHRNSSLFRKAFDIEIVPTIELLGKSTPVLLVDEWPGLKQHLNRLGLSDLELIRCNQIGFDSSGFELSCWVKGDNIYTLGGDERDELQAIVLEIKLSLTESEITQIISRQTAEDIKAARAKIRSKSTDAERLLAAVGERALIHGLPAALRRYREEEDQEAAGIRAAEATIAIYDVGALWEYRDLLQDLSPPSRWAGSRPAVEFVRSLGFSEEWAGQSRRGRPPFIEVDGPFNLPKLHDYQRKIANNLRAMLRRDILERRRGLISLPTGAGKTLVAVQAIVEAIRNDEYTGGVLWIADRDELCEQAVEAWRRVWSNIGVDAAPLRISRLWQGNKNPTPVGFQHVIVASIQTLNSRVVRQSEDSRFLEAFKLVVFDEAHHSIAPSYTQVMAKLGLTFRRKEDEPFLIGLTATPYRGHNEEETQRLAKRYEQNRLDAGAFSSAYVDHFSSAYADQMTNQLQDTRVLAFADHETIEGGDFTLTKEALQEMLEKGVAWLPPSFEIAMGLDRDRTRRILRAYDEHIRGQGWPTLIFATSVDHARTLAALLNEAGVTARSVDGTTPHVVRRKIVKDFRAGQIEALVNYNVFTEGFDAPQTRAIMVARPVYSPNLYFQMIGRGLRGPKNGGNERCLILNVKDNIVNYEEKLAFTELDWLWADGH